MFSSPSFTKEGVEGVVPSPDGLVTGHLPIWLDPMFQAVELPAGIANLDTSLADMDGDALTLWEGRQEVSECDASDGTFRNDSHGNDY